MSIESIVDTAVEIADKGGLSAVSMSSVATVLGFTPMSLYRYVTAKDDLVLLMQERGIGVPPESITEAENWRAGLLEWATSQTSMYVDHSWLLDIPIAGIPVTPNNLAWLDAALQVLEGTAASYDEKISIVLAITAQVRWQGIVNRGYTEAAAAEGTSPNDLEVRDSSVLQSLVTATQFPFVHAAMAAGVFGPGDSDPFQFGIERVLDGVERFLEGRPAAQADPVDPLLEGALRDPKVKESIKARREVEKQLREARKREREQIRNAKERLSR
jgi:AcrR family transcriptional regulator